MAKKNLGTSIAVIGYVGHGKTCLTAIELLSQTKDLAIVYEADKTVNECFEQGIKVPIKPYNITELAHDYSIKDGKQLRRERRELKRKKP